MSSTVTNSELAMKTVARPRAALQLRGSDAAKFLQGQTTCDLLALAQQPAGTMISGAHCTPKGRMIFDFSAFFNPDAEDELVLLTAPDLAATALASLKKYAVFFKVEISDVSAQWQQLLVFAANREPLAAELGAVQELGEQIFTVTLPAGAALPTQLAGAAPADEGWAHNQLLAAGIAELCAATSDLFIPQMLNYDHRGFISFKKGCYTGQEIIARAHYRGAVKRRLALLQASGVLPATVQPGAELRDSDGRAVGTIAAVGAAQLLAAVTEPALALSQFGVDQQLFDATASALVAAAE